MFEIMMIKGGDILNRKTCDVGALLPTIAALMQEFEIEHGAYEHQRNYAVQWRRVRE